MKDTRIPANVVRPLIITFVALLVIVLGVFSMYRTEESPRDAAPRVHIEADAIPEGWVAYTHPSYALAHPADIAVSYDETFDILSFYYSENATDPIARVFPSRTVEEELEQLKRISGSTVNTADVYADAILLTRVSLSVPNDRGGEDLISYYMFRDKLNSKTYTMKMDADASWEDFNAVAQTLRTP